MAFICALITFSIVGQLTNGIGRERLTAWTILVFRSWEIAPFKKPYFKKIIFVSNLFFVFVSFHLWINNVYRAHIKYHTSIAYAISKSVSSLFWCPSDITIFPFPCQFHSLFEVKEKNLTVCFTSLTQNRQALSNTSMNNFWWIYFHGPDTFPAQTHKHTHIARNFR